MIKVLLIDLLKLLVKKSLVYLNLLILNLKDRAKGTKNVINGKDAISEIVTYSLTDPRIFRLLNELHSTTERVEGSENLETPTFLGKV